MGTKDTPGPLPKSGKEESKKRSIIPPILFCETFVAGDAATALGGSCKLNNSITRPQLTAGAAGKPTYQYQYPPVAAARRSKTAGDMIPMISQRKRCGVCPPLAVFFDKRPCCTSNAPLFLWYGWLITGVCLFTIQRAEICQMPDSRYQIPRVACGLYGEIRRKYLACRVF